jgi:hypothetical protein
MGFGVPALRRRASRALLSLTDGLSEQSVFVRRSDWRDSDQP